MNKQHLLLLLLLRVSPALSVGSLSDYTRLPLTDMTPCVPLASGPCVRVGNCGDYPPNPNGPCNMSYVADQCTATYGCVAFNYNGWLKGCGNVSCGTTFEPAAGDSYFLTASGGMPPPPLPCPNYVVPVEDVFYPDEEPAESAAAAPSLQSSGEGWVVLAPPGGTTGSPVNTSIGGWAFNFQLLAVLPPGALPISGGPFAVLERTFSRWGFFAFVSASGGEVARLRKGTGEADNLVMPRYSYLADQACGYYANVYNNATDLIAALLLAEPGGDGEADYVSALKYLPPQRDYASIGGIWPYNKFSVSPDGRIKIADAAIYTPTSSVNESQPGVLVFDPARAIPEYWPALNWTFTKSALVGRWLRVVAVIGYDFDTGFGFEEVAFAPASEPAASAYVRLRPTEDGEWGAFAYFNASSKAPTTALDPNEFYAALFAEQALWNETFTPATQYTLPGREGARQTDTAFGGLVTSMSLFVGLTSNYGDGESYWSPQVDRGGSLPFQEIAVVQSQIDIGLAEEAGERLGWWFDNYIKADGEISTGDWEVSCPNGFADGLADFGEMQDIFVRVARAQLAVNTANGTAWIDAHMDQAWRLANYSYHLRLAAVARGDANVTKGLIFGPPEHDTCHEPGYYYHNNAWFYRGLVEMGKFLRDVCGSLPVCAALAPQGPVFLTEAALFRADIEASLALSVTTNADGSPFFIPPIAALGMKPFVTMIESTLAEYSNFRYYAELLGADFLSPALSNALQDFRETHTGTVSGITRWSDHLDDMPSSYYMAASLRDDRIPRALLLQYGHMANYMGRGTGTATEQLPINADANGLSRDYLWGYLEGGIDQCIPSIMLSSIATRWQLVLERYDEDVLFLARGAPKRWFLPSNGGFSVERAATRFGSVSLAVVNAVGASGVGEDSRATIGFQLWPGPTPGVGLPTFALRLRASNGDFLLVPASVVVGGSGVLGSVNATTNTIMITLQGAAPYSISVAASFR
jgi:hypothetical protein